MCYLAIRAFGGYDNETLQILRHHFGVYVMANGKKQQAFVEIPDEIESEIYGEERAYQKAKVEKELAVGEEHEKHYNAVMDMLNK